MIDNLTLMDCVYIIEGVSQPPVIPYYEGFTYSLVAQFYGVEVKKVQKVFRNHKDKFLGNYCEVSGGALKYFARKVFSKKNYKSIDLAMTGQDKVDGRSGYICEYANGVTVELSCFCNKIFNYRGLIIYAEMLKDISKTAQAVVDKLNEVLEHGTISIKTNRPWFEENIHAARGEYEALKERYWGNAQHPISPISTFNSAFPLDTPTAYCGNTSAFNALLVDDKQLCKLGKINLREYLECHSEKSFCEIAKEYYIYHGRKIIQVSTTKGTVGKITQTFENVTVASNILNRSAKQLAHELGCLGYPRHDKGYALVYEEHYLQFIEYLADYYDKEDFYIPCVKYVWKFTCGAA